jgi:hypothetical protein
MGIPDRTPNVRASYEAEQTTPRPSGLPPTRRWGARPAPSGSTILATAQNMASQSASKMRGDPAESDMGSKIRGSSKFEV